MARADRMWRRVAKAAAGAFLFMVLLWAGRALNMFGWLDVLDTPPRVLAERGEEPLGVRRTFKHSGFISTLAFSPDGAYVAAGGLLDNTVSIWEVRTGALARRLESEMGGVNALAWSPDGRLLASGRGFVRLITDRIAVNLWEARTGRLVHNLPGPFQAADGSNDVRSLAFHPAGDRLAVGVAGGAVAIYDPSSAAVLGLLRGHPALGWVVAYSRDGKYLATSGESEHAPVEIYDGRTDAHVRSLVARISSQPTLAFSPDGRFLASSGYDTPAITIWDVSAGAPVRMPLWGHTGPIRSLEYSPDGKWLVSGSGADSIKIWAMPRGRIAASLRAGQSAGSVARFSPDGQYLASTDGDVLKLWEFAAARPLLLKELEGKGN